MKNSKFPSIRFKGFTDPWEQRKLGNVVSRFATGLNPRDNFTLNNGGKNYYVTIKNFTHGNLVLDDNCDKIDDKALALIQERSDLQIGDILFSSIGRVGDCFLIENKPINWNINESVFVLRPVINYVDPLYLMHTIHSERVLSVIISYVTGSTFKSIKMAQLKETNIPFTDIVEQKQIGKFITIINNLITLHQRELYDGGFMIRKQQKEFFYVYFENWISVYKEGAIRKVTMDKYRLSLSWLQKLAPKLRLNEINRTSYQQLLNDYAKSHERQTTMDFHHHLKSAILDAVDEGYIDKDPTRKVIIKGKNPRQKKIKFLNQFQLHMLLQSLELGSEINYDWLILLIAKTGMRFSEAVALTPEDFDFSKQTLSINKTWNYKGNGGFQPTKNKSSVRKIQIDWMVVSQFASLVKDLPKGKPIFIKEAIFNSTINDLLARRCEKASIPAITVHGLRHTHASLLLFGGVSIASVAKRLGHSSMNTTEKTYLHIIQELENKDVDLVMRSLSGL